MTVLNEGARLDYQHCKIQHTIRLVNINKTTRLGLQQKSDWFSNNYATLVSQHQDTQHTVRLVYTSGFRTEKGWMTGSQIMVLQHKSRQQWVRLVYNLYHGHIHRHLANMVEKQSRDILNLGLSTARQWKKLQNVPPLM